MDNRDEGVPDNVDVFPNQIENNIIDGEPDDLKDTISNSDEKTKSIVNVWLPIPYLEVNGKPVNWTSNIKVIVQKAI